MTRTLILAGGGTGGHVYPLVAVADALRQLDPSVLVVFVGTDKGLEGKIVPSRGYSLELMRVVPIRGAGLGGAVRGIAGALAALPDGYRLLRRLRPNAVLTVGGYAAGPVSAMARLQGIPLALLEPNAAMGLSNRIIAPWVNRAYTAFESLDQHFGARIVLRSGVPIRSGFAPCPWRREGRAQRVLVIGGSQGARTLNENVPSALAQQSPPVSVRHQCGAADLEVVRKRYVAAGLTDAVVESFIEDMPSALRDADLVISRAGASAVSEICAVGRASLLIPFPFAADNHQQKNAELLAGAGAAIWVHNSLATPTRLSEEIARLLHDPSLMQNMAAKARATGRPEAATAIARDLMALAGLMVPAQQSALVTKESG